QHTGGCAEREPIESAIRSGVTRIGRPCGHGTRFPIENEYKGKYQQDRPNGLRPLLQLVDQRYAVERERDDDERADQVPRDHVQSNTYFQSLRHDGGFEREEYERERGIDQGGDRRTDVSESGAAGQEINIDICSARVVCDGQAYHEDE